MEREPSDFAARFCKDGFVVARSAVPRSVTCDIATRIERAIAEMAHEIDVDVNSYLSVACRWDFPNRMVALALEAVTEHVREYARPVSGASPAFAGATLFRQSRHAHLGTHPHQDVSYRWQKDRAQYHLTTWVTLDAADATSGALQVLPGSHEEPLRERVDFLDRAERSRFDPREWARRAYTIAVDPGDIVIFDARLWHGSHATVRDAVRRALAIRWRVEGVSFFVPPPETDRSKFGMDTSGEFVARALSHLLGPDSEGLSLPGLVAHALSREVHAALPRPDAACRALSRLQILLVAQERHHAAAQQGMVWESVRDEVVEPILLATGEVR